MTIPTGSIPVQYPLKDIPTPYIYSSTNPINNAKNIENNNSILKRKRSLETLIDGQESLEIKRTKVFNDDNDDDMEIPTQHIEDDIDEEQEEEQELENGDNISGDGITTTEKTEHSTVPTNASSNATDCVLTIDDVKDGILDEALPISPVASASGDRLQQHQHQHHRNHHDNDNDVLTPPCIINNERKQKQLHDELMKSNYSTLDGLKNITELQCMAFKFISQLNRAQLTDINSLIRDNLKRDMISTLPTEIALNILAKLDFCDIISCLAVSPHWNHIIENTPFIWKHLLISESFIAIEGFSNYIKDLKLNYPHLSNFEDAYKPDFLKRSHTLKNWYNPKFIPQRTTLKGHMTSVVTCLQFADDYVITGADDKMIRVYSAKQKKFLLELAGHEGGVWALKYDVDGILVSGSTDRSVRVWDIKRGCCLYVFKGHTSTVRCLDIVEYKNNKYIVTGSRDNTLHVWKLCKSAYNRGVDNKNKDDDTNSASTSSVWPIVYDTPDVNPYFVGVLKGHVASVRTVSGHGNIVISGSYDNTLMVWDIAQMKCLYILSGHTDRIYSTIYDHKRQRCISASMDSTVRVWDLKDLWRNGIRQTVTCAGTTCTRVTESYKVLSGHTALVGLLKLSDKYLISAAADGTLKGWDAEDYSLKFSYLHSNLSAITTFHMTDNILVSGSERQFNIYNLRNGNLVHSNLLRDAEQIWSVNFKDNLLVAAVEKNGQSSIEMLDFA
ncbi:similar to Saccharomyces cerevisiae YFL009W CDC4 F-box protein required for G1/S and G2/M transition [Maudiozyma barnettii]|uniref:Similar to Saccharomyces cerevisiae YFL009W CDC4 F-box protein required for G1/S and G2/M transition n=1 Tax=Maudiozyma barnettii TaxID=61262 RepID=A0A8H2VBY4_9SACH|nr:SCF ubiquitin ligase complex subunit CDC4 [Kazachstania barnettii]CAB4252443.1 similar to Saccharomyces cerevisiae YFL009W CDC4 F-box protein required for G1/S and G2/M transition [Kazachstania barnettii]CAD1779178.1 similar to Saccharomyces cerevisiae YFL009W CDC4 F-box protein required for G1/S and G2/M transition [Kazachstania barnettii]